MPNEDLIAAEKRTPDYGPGSRVRIVPEWCDHPAEAKDVYIVVEWNGDRGFIRPLHYHPGARIIPQSLVRTQMITPA